MAAIEDRSFEEPENDPFPSSETTPELKPLPSEIAVLTLPSGNMLFLIIIVLTPLLYHRS